MGGKTLIFPGGMPGSLTYLEQCRSSGRPVVGASSLSYDPNASQYGEWVRIPFLTDAGFDEALDALIADHRVTDIFTPHPIIWDHLRVRSEQGRLAASLSNSSPTTSDSEPYRQAIAISQHTSPPIHLGEARPGLSEVEAASLVYHAGKIAGMCDGDKARALMEIFRDLPQGDVVEIGSWWGKSAFIMLRLAQIHGVGPLLCIDPWASENFVQNDSSGLVDKLVESLDADEAHQIFTMNLLPYAKGDANYLRMPSDQALATFVSTAEVRSPEFGSVIYSRRIAALHIDGNHAYPQAKADIVGWTKLVAPGGWIIIDDYVWPWGDGPQRAGDEFLADHHRKISCAFVMGTALFLKLEEAV